MASDAPPDSPTNSAHFDDPIQLDVIACVTFYTKSQSSSKGKKVKTVTTKETRAKDFTFVFAPTKTNYIVFLQEILEKPHLTKYKVPPASKSNATYVINFNEYKGLANKILKKSPSGPLTVFIEMPDIERVFSKFLTFYSAEEDQKWSLLAF
ncbi:hypothetical protein EI94DRAFT_1703223 [Lactarius quietus]|nr:hypothetical protein EI94DRAFT_1703223 [Lactarius quietus]